MGGRNMIISADGMRLDTFNMFTFKIYERCRLVRLIVGFVAEVDSQQQA